MTPALTPARALDYLAALSTDLRAAAVLDATGALLAGDAALAAGARGLLPAAGAGPVRAAAGADTVLLARDARHAVAVRVGPGHLEPVVLVDLRSVLEAL